MDRNSEDPQIIAIPLSDILGALLEDMDQTGLALRAAIQIQEDNMQATYGTFALCRMIRHDRSDVRGVSLDELRIALNHMFIAAEHLTRAVEADDDEQKQGQADALIAIRKARKDAIEQLS